MAKNAEFKIVINGIQESINAVDALNKELDALEKRINTLANKNVSVSASGGGNAKAALDEEAKMLQKIDELHQKVAASEKAEYQELLHAKEELKEYQTIAKSIAAQTNLDQGINNTNTMAGMKAQLHDIKAAMQTLDVESDKFKQLQQDANELNTKLKEIEQGYGQFGRNVGNYAEGVAEGMQKIVIKVGDTEREFNNAREASRTLNMELKNMALNGQQGTEAYDELNEAVKQMNSTLKDIEVSSVGMDNLLDTMQGLTALASVGQGISALFGVDDTAIEKSIQKLVALQNVLQGIETINKQITSQEGIGSWIAKGNKAIDSMVTAIFGVGTASKSASVAVKTLSTALKGIGIGVAIAGIMEIINLIESWSEKQKKAAEEVEAEAEKVKKAIDDQRNAYVSAAAQYNNTASRLSHLRTEYQKTNDQLQKTAILKEASAEFKKLGINISGVNDAQTMLVKNGGKVIELLKLQGDAAAIASLRMEAYKKSFNMLLENGYDATSASILAGYNSTVRELDKRLDVINPKIAELQKGLGIDREKTVKSNGKKVEDAVRQAETNINDLRLKLMRDGLHKELAQLDENNRREIEKIRKNGQKVEEQRKLQQQNYERERQKILDQYRSETDKILSENRITETNTQIKELENELDSLRGKIDITFNKPVGTMDELEKDLASFGSSIEEYQRFVKAIGDIREERRQKYGKGFFNEVEQPDENNYLPSPDAIDEAGKEATKELEIVFDKIKEKVGERYAELFRVYSKYGGLLDIISENGDEKEYAVRLNTSFQTRTEITRGAFKELYDLYREYYKQRADLQIKNIDEEEKRLTEDLDNKLEILKAENETLLAENKNIFENLNPNGTGNTYNEKYINNDEIYKANLERIKAYEEERNGIVRKYEAERVSIENSKNEELSRLNDEWFSQRLKDYDDYLSKLNNAIAMQPVVTKAGFIDLSATKENLKEAEDLIAEMRKSAINDITLVQDQFAQGLITSEDKNRIIANLNDVLNDVEEGAVSIGEKTKELPEEVWKRIDFWIQQVGQAASQIIKSIGDINQAAFEKQLEAIERQTDALEDQLDKQRELTQKYADDVNDIEDELENSRGSRRQFLIDQLNAQMEAQRESLAQEKRIEKEQERLDKKREQLEYENEMRKWNQSKLTAAINAALAISAAAVNSYPIPAIPMMALAATVGAAQMAAVIAQKPRKYAEGGLLEGRSHIQGGIPVGNSGIEVEGNEFVTNKRTTSQNLALLQFINSKKRKIDLSDMIEFYSSKVNKNISNTKTYFADGGQIPVLRNDIDLSDRLITTMEKYSEKPTVVQVVDIINKAESLRQVQTLAGLS